jgi:hypothetical protein
VLICEEQTSCGTCEKLETALRIANAAHAEEPHQEVEDEHQQCPEEGPLYDDKKTHIQTAIQKAQLEAR